MLHSQDNKSGKCDEDGEKNQTEGRSRQAPFCLVVIPDICMTLDSTEIELKPISIKFPSASIIIIGLPGSPGTVWPRGTSLSPELHSNAITKILNYLQNENRIFSHGSSGLGERKRGREKTTETDTDGGRIRFDDPMLLLGFGIGGHSLLNFVATSLSATPLMANSMKCVILVNAVFTLSRCPKLIFFSLHITPLVRWSTLNYLTLLLLRFICLTFMSVFSLFAISI